MADQLAAYKAIRGRLERAAATLLTGQAMLNDGPPWDVIEEISTAPEAVTIFAFDDARAAPRVVVHRAACGRMSSTTSCRSTQASWACLIRDRAV